LAGDHSELILGSPAVRSLLLIGEEEDDGKDGALGTPLGVALLSVKSSSCSGED
jgi:hypothetical protein